MTRAAWFIIFFVCGAALRLVWVSDMEYKYDERYMFERSQNIGVTEPWPLIGMTSGVGLHNPGLSIWIFKGIATTFSARTPEQLCLAVRWLNIAALALVGALAWIVVPLGERPFWLWGGALAAVNPVAVLLERKIWAQSTLPIFCSLFLLGWWRRDRAWGAFVWGLLGALLGQIHMSGFFFAAGVWAWTWLFNRRNSTPVGTRWIFWAAGCGLGALPLWPWLAYLARAPRPTSAYAWHRLLEFKYFIAWIKDAMGFGLDYSVGGHFRDFLGSPRMGGHETFLVAAIHIGLGLLSVVWLRRQFVRMRAPVAASFCGDDSQTGLIVSAALWGTGVLMTLAALRIYRHYLIVTFPLIWVATARSAFTHFGEIRASRWLIALALSSLALSVGFLLYIHFNHGAPGADYGITYSSQRG